MAMETARIAVKASTAVSCSPPENALRFSLLWRHAY
jgi:hypothetical protein